MSVSEKSLELIKKNNVSPTPGWTFTAKEGCLVSVSILTLVFGAISFGIILFNLSENELDVYTYTKKTIFEHFFESLPLIFVLLVILFTTLLFVEFKNTKKGYRYNPVFVVFGAVLIMVGLGTFMQLSGVSAFAHNWIQVNFGGVDTLSAKRAETWSHPENGLLGGVIEDIRRNEIVLKDSYGYRWYIDISNVPFKDKLALTKGQVVKVIGTQLDSNDFVAMEVRISKIELWNVLK